MLLHEEGVESAYDRDQKLVGVLLLVCVQVFVEESHIVDERPRSERLQVTAAGVFSVQQLKDLEDSILFGVDFVRLVVEPVDVAPGRVEGQDGLQDCIDVAGVAQIFDAFSLHSKEWKS